MNWSIKYYLIYIFLCAPFLIKANLPDSIFQAGDSLFKAGSFFKAGIEYEYIAFFADSTNIKTIAKNKRIDCFTQLGKFEQAQNYAEKVPIFNTSDTLKYEIIYKRALNAYLAGNFGNAKAHFMQLKHYFPNDVITSDDNVLYILILNELNEWQNAKNEALDWIQKIEIQHETKDSLIKVVQNFYSDKRIPKLKSVKKAQTFSTFVPGSGQVYAGYPLEGVFNLTLHLASLAFAAEEILAGYYITGYLGGFGMFQKLYFGGIRRTEYLTNKTNYKRSQEFNQKAKEFILDID